MKVITMLLLMASAAYGNTWVSTQWNEGVKVNNRNDGGFAFSFPVCGNHVNAIQTDRKAIPLGKTILMRFKVIKVKGRPNFVSLDPAPVPPGLLPNFRPMLQVANDNYYDEDNRWWPAGLQCAFLKANMDGDWHEVRIKLKPSLWQNVFGKLATQRGNAFQDVISHSGKLNIVFGGGNSFSHGVCARAGRARVVVNVKVVS